MRLQRYQICQISSRQVADDQSSITPLTFCKRIPTASAYQWRQPTPAHPAGELVTMGFLQRRNEQKMAEQVFNLKFTR